MSAFGYTMILAAIAGGVLAVRSTQSKLQRRIVWSFLVFAIAITLFAAGANFRVAYNTVKASGAAWTAESSAGATAMAGVAFTQIVTLSIIVVALGILALRRIK